MPSPLVPSPISILTGLNANIPVPSGFPTFTSEQILDSPKPLYTFWDVQKFLDHLLLCGCGGRKDGLDWVIPINGKYYAIYWRDKAPTGPATRQVWDVYCFQWSGCPECPTLQRSLGHFWCWEDVITVISSDQEKKFRPPYEGAGGYTVLVGTDVYEAGSVSPQIRPKMWLDASDTTTLTLDGVFVEAWGDKSLFDQHASQGSAPNRPTLVPNAQNNLPVVRFDPSSETWMDLIVRNQESFHLFVVGRFNANPLHPQGVFLSAAGFEDPFSGVEGGVYQDASLQPEGSLYTVVNPSPGTISSSVLLPVATSGEFTIFEWSQVTAAAGCVNFGNNAVLERAYQGDTSIDFWDSQRQTFGQPTPLKGALGRQNQGVNPSSAYNYLDGDIGEVLLYPEVLTEGQRVSVLNTLRAKWGLGAPLAFPSTS